MKKGKSQTTIYKAVFDREDSNINRLSSSSKESELQDKEISPGRDSELIDELKVASQRSTSPTCPYHNRHC